MMTDSERARFDELLDLEIALLPAALRALLDESPLIVEDFPSRDLLEELGMLDDDQEVLCGLHTGVPLTERSVTAEAGLEFIHLFRQGIIELAGGWQGRDACERVREEIRITLLHEIGHHYGLTDEDLESLGYG